MDAVIEEKHDYSPYALFTGPLAATLKYYSVFRKIKYEAKSIIEAVEFTVKIYKTFSKSYPSETNHAWVFMQRNILKLLTPEDKLITAVHQASSFVRREVEIRIAEQSIQQSVEESV